MSKPQLLCIDDDPQINSALARDLRDLFDVYCVPDFDEAKKIMSENFSIVICDFHLDDTNGAVVLDWIRKKFPSSMRILLTGMASNDELEQLISEGIIHKFIFKPWETDTLRLNMLEALSIRKLLSERDRFKELSITDPITGLTNHRFFQEKLRIELSRAKKTKSPLSLIMIDVDHFKLLNDQYGHPMGDQVLAEIAQQLSGLLKAKYSLSRYGGEEFAVILPGTHNTAAYAFAESLRESIANMTKFNFRTSISLGVASYPENGLDADELIAVADQALYCAKRQGRNMSVVGSDI